MSTSVTLFGGKEFSLQLLTTACCSISRGSDPSDLHRHLHPCVHPHTQPNTEPQLQILRKRIFKNLKKTGLLYALLVFTPEGTHVSPAWRNFHIHVFCSIGHKSQDVHSHTSCPSTQEQIEKMWYLYIMECYSDIKKNKTMTF